MKYVYEHGFDRYPYLFLGRYGGKYIFIIKGISHSHLLLGAIKDRAHRNDLVFLVRQSWYHDDHLFKDSDDVIKSYGLNKSNFHYLHNTEDEMARATMLGFNGIYCNANCFQDEKQYHMMDLTHRYKAVYIARYDKCKRHELVPDRADMALVSIRWPDNIRDTFKNVFMNKHTFTAHEICRIINQSAYGLCLSAVEGQCRAAIEYLYCGIPIISTPSKGGRDVWYTPHNHIIVESKEDILDAVKAIRTFDGDRIREDAIELAQVFRARFYELLYSITGCRPDLGNRLYAFSKGSAADLLKNIN